MKVVRTDCSLHFGSCYQCFLFSRASELQHFYTMNCIVYSSVRSVAVVTTKLSFCCVMVVTRVSTRTASDRSWWTSQRETGTATSVSPRYVGIKLS